MKSYIPLLVGLLGLFASCKSSEEKKKEENAGKEDAVVTKTNQPVDLPAPYASESVQNYCDVIGWPDGKAPTAPPEFSVIKFAGGLDNPRWIYVAGNGDIFVAESTTETKGVKKLKSNLNGKAKSQNLGESANRITLMRDADHDGKPELKKVFLTGLNQPFGMLIMNNNFYVGNTDAVVMYPYKTGDTGITVPGKKILELPAGGYNNHWTRNLIASRDGKKILISVGSGSNVAEHGMENEIRRANILEINPDGSGELVYAYGLRNPVGMGFAPGTSTLWTAVNERDELGDELVPDYMTSVKRDGFYGWPYAYFGQHEDPRMKGKNPELVQKTIVPDLALGSHTASLGLAFDEQNALPGRYSGGAFVGQHGSWNSSKLVGYMIGFVPFKSGKPTGNLEPFLTGFIASEAEKKVYGRPVGVAFTKQNEMLVADDSGNTIWLVKANNKNTSTASR